VVLTPEQRRLRASAAAFAQWARTEDWSARTKPARDAFMSRFEAEVDPEGRLDPELRAKRAQAAMRSHMRRLALRSNRARAARKRGEAGD
jgi:hypothetical protein